MVTNFSSSKKIWGWLVCFTNYAQNRPSFPICVIIVYYIGSSTTSADSLIHHTIENITQWMTRYDFPNEFPIESKTQRLTNRNNEKKETKLYFFQNSINHNFYCCSDE